MIGFMKCRLQLVINNVIYWARISMSVMAFLRSKKLTPNGPKGWVDDFTAANFFKKIPGVDRCPNIGCQK